MAMQVLFIIHMAESYFLVAYSNLFTKILPVGHYLFCKTQKTVVFKLHKILIGVNLSKPYTSVA